MNDDDDESLDRDPPDFVHAPDLTPDELPGPRHKTHTHSAPPRTEPSDRRPHHGGHRLRTHYGGWRPADPHHRHRIADTFGIHLRSEVDPRDELPPVFNQGHLGSCTANATAAAFQYDAFLDGIDTGPLSRLWIYYRERMLEDTLGRGDCGARGFDAFQVAAEVGVPPEVDWPYSIDTYAGPPPPRAVRDQGYYTLTKPYASPPPTKHAFKQVLSNRQTIAFGFSVYESFDTPAVAKSGIVPVPKRGEEILGGHEVLAVGYLKSEPEFVLVRNSWGSRATGGRGWGIDGSGYCLMPWRMVLDPAMAGDWTTIVRPIWRR